MIANREVLHQIGWTALGSRQELVPRIWESRIRFRTGRDNFGERGRRKHRVDATNDKSRVGRSDPLLLAQTARKYKAGRDWLFYRWAWPEIITAGGEPRNVSLRVVLYCFLPLLTEYYKFLPIAILLDYHQSVLAFGPKKKPRTLLFPTIELKLVACPLEQRGANCEESTCIVGRADSLLHRLHAT